MKYNSRSFVGFFSVATGALAIFATIHFNLLARDTKPSPSLNIDSAPIVRDVKSGTSFAPIVKKAAPSVVNIYTSRTIKVSPMMNPFQNDPFFRQFFGDQPNQPRTRKENSLGSGVIVSSDGYILTANHVVNGADEIKVALGDDDRKKFTAKVVGSDPQTDVAVLKIETTGLPAITLGDSDQLEVGDVVLALGNPFGVGQTVTMGIISGLGRHGYGINGYENFIQTDAAINPGNSGGALVDAQGRLVGINTWIATRSGGSEGVGFAVPANMARHVMERLISGGKVTRGFLGVLPQDITPLLAKSFNLSDQNGALVGNVVTNSPAEKAGIKSGDVIIAFNRKKVLDAHNLTLQVSDCAPGSQATVELIHDGKRKTLTVTLGENKQGRIGDESENDSASDNSTTDALDGVTVTDLDHDARQQLQISDDIKGALVTDIEGDSNSAEAGLQKNDVIVEIEHHPVTDAASAVKLCKQVKGDQILLKIWRRAGDNAVTLWLGVDNTKKDKKEK
jgi:serine protease Do